MPTRSDAGTARRDPPGALLTAWSVTRLFYYLAILLGLVLLYGRGDVSTTGFIYQAF